MSNKIYHDVSQNLVQFASKSICESCQKSSETKNLSDRINFSEAKEEEKDCHYCYEEHIKCSAETLFNGRPSCKECKKKNFISFVSPIITGQKIMITQVVKNNNNQYNTLIASTSSSQKSPQKNRTISMFPSTINFNNQNMDYQEQPQSTSATHAKTFSLNNDEGFKTKLKTNLQHKKTNLQLIIDESDDGSDLGISLPQPFLSVKNSTAQKIFVNNNSTPRTNKDDENGKNTIIDYANVKRSQFRKLDIIPVDVLNTPTSSIHSGGDANESKKSDTPLSVRILEFRDPKLFNLLHKILSGEMTALKSNLIYSISKDKLGSKYFHFKCDGKAPIILALILQSGAIFGGFIYKTLDPKISEKKDEMAGLFYSVENNQIMFHKVSEKVVIYKKTGIVFGNPTMLEINFDTLNNINWNIDLKENSPTKKGLEWNKFIKDIIVLKL